VLSHARILLTLETFLQYVRPSISIGRAAQAPVFCGCFFCVISLSGFAAALCRRPTRNNRAYPPFPPQDAPTDISVTLLNAGTPVKEPTGLGTQPSHGRFVIMARPHHDCLSVDLRRPAPRTKAHPQQSPAFKENKPLDSTGVTPILLPSTRATAEGKSIVSSMNCVLQDLFFWLRSRSRKTTGSNGSLVLDRGNSKPKQIEGGGARTT